MQQNKPTPPQRATLTSASHRDTFNRYRMFRRRLTGYPTSPLSGANSSSESWRLAPILICPSSPAASWRRPTAFQTQALNLTSPSPPSPTRALFKPRKLQRLKSKAILCICCKITKNSPKSKEEALPFRQLLLLPSQEQSSPLYFLLPVDHVTCPKDAVRKTRRGV